MTSYLEDIVTMLPDAYRSTQFNVDDLMVLIKGVTGFASSKIAGDPFMSLSTVIEIAEHFRGQCNAGTLLDNLDRIEKWLTFGKAYAALEDSSDLDFDQMDVGSVPEMMKVI